MEVKHYSNEKCRETYKQDLATNMPKQTCNVILNFILFNLYPPCYEAYSSHFTRTLFLTLE